jgi:hypothetical protein
MAKLTKRLVDAGGVPALWAVPKRAAKDRAIQATHGGGQAQCDRRCGDRGDPRRSGPWRRLAGSRGFQVPDHQGRPAAARGDRRHLGPGELTKLGRPWAATRMPFAAILERFNWFNNRRFLEPIGHIPPAAAEARYYAANRPQAIAACRKSKRLRQTRRDSKLLTRPHLERLPFLRA